MNHVRRSIPSSHAQHARGAIRRGFTVLELRVVAGILVLLLGIAVAVISNVAYSSERSLAENQLRVGMTAARDAAIRSKSGDAAAVFYFRDGRALIQPCVKVGQLKAPPSSDPNYAEWQTRLWNNAVSTDDADDYDVFVPVPEVEPITMPRNWTIRGFAAAGSLHVDEDNRRNGWYEWIDQADATHQLANAGLWVFPETDFIPRDAEGLLPLAQVADMDTQGWRRQSFCVRFEAQTGEVVFGNTKPFLVLDAQEAPYRFDTGSLFSAFDIEQQEDPAMSVTRALSAGGKQRLAGITGQPADVALQRLFGNRSTDMILVRPVFSISLTDERRLASAIGLRGLNRDTTSMYRQIGAAAPSNQLPIDGSLATFTGTGSVEGEMMTRISQYITSSPDTWGEQISLEARVYTLSRYAGQLQEVNPGSESGS